MSRKSGNRFSDKDMRKLKELGCAMTKDTDDRGQPKRPGANAARRQRAYHRKTHYNMTLEEEAELIRQQGGACAICGERPDELHVDHCHITGKVRGMLCLGCN